MGWLGLIEVLLARRGERRGSSLHDVVWCRSAMIRMGLESCGVRTPTSREQVILHRDRRIHVPTLRHMVSVNGLLLLLLLMHPRVHLLVLLGPTCIWRSLTKVLRRAWTSLLRRGVGGEPWSCIGRGRVTPWTLGRTLLVGGVRLRHDAC